MVEVFGDGSYTTPTKWWTAMVGLGVWIKDWNLPGENQLAKQKSKTLPNQLLDK